DGIRDATVTGVQTCALPIYQLYARFHPAPPAAVPHHQRASARISASLRDGSLHDPASGPRARGCASGQSGPRGPRRGEVNMTATTLTAPLLLTNDLLTGAEWSPAQVKQLLHLTADIK